MNGDMIIKTISILMGLVFLISSLFYRKKDHKKAREEGTVGNYSGSLIASIIGGIIGIFLQLAPWWLSKMLFFLIGAGLIYIGLFLI